MKLQTFGVAVSCSAFLSFLPVLTCSASPRWTGDVPARDLSIPGLGSLGHIGMYKAKENCRWENNQVKCDQDYILEVLNEATVIQQHSYKNFASRSRVWSPQDSRYYASCELCQHNWRGVINAGMEQKNWSPSYTYSASYTEGKMVKKNGKWVRQNAKFRCDGFVVYSYIKGINHNISRTVQTPRRVWQGLPYDYSWDNSV